MTPKKTFTLIIILLAAYLILLVNGCTQTSYTYGIIGTPAVSADGQYIAVLLAESRGTTRQVNGGYRATDYHTAFWLKQYETATGKLVQKKKIIADAEDQNLLVHCYGGYADKIWLHSSGLKAYSISNLEETVNEGQLTTDNNFDKNNFPDDERMIEQHIAEGYINFTAESGNKYQIDLTTLKFSNWNDAAKKTGDAISEQLHSFHSGNASIGSRCDTLDGKVYFLAKDSSTASSSQPGNTNEGPVYKQLHLFTANYTTGIVGNYRYWRYSNMQQRPGASFLNGIFLKDCSTNKTIQSKQSGRLFILHNNNPGNNAQSMLTCIDSSNKIIWQFNTGISTALANCIAKGQYCILIGNKHSIIAPHIGNDMLCIIHLASGNMHTVAIHD